MYSFLCLLEDFMYCHESTQMHSASFLNYNFDLFYYSFFIRYCQTISGPSLLATGMRALSKFKSYLNFSGLR